MSELLPEFSVKAAFAAPPSSPATTLGAEFSVAAVFSGNDYESLTFNEGLRSVSGSFSASGLGLLEFPQAPSTGLAAVLAPFFKGDPGESGETLQLGTRRLITVAGKLVRVNLEDGTHKELFYTADRFIRIDHVKPSQTIRRDLTYVGETLDTITTSVV